jgi:hypothetical protein
MATFDSEAIAELAEHGSNCGVRQSKSTIVDEELFRLGMRQDSVAKLCVTLESRNPALGSVCDSPSLVSFNVEKRSRLTNLSRMAFTGR